ncbi:MAG: DnaD domain protein [Oscillospiraceae bacterium]|nr:DnaD domain protein [Oscillospiraceae bacterium]
MLFDFAPQAVLYDATPVENLFIQEYMPRAEGDFVKAYLYGLMQCYHPSKDASLQTVARDLGMDEDQLRNAYSYWERVGLVRRVSDNPPSYAFMNLKQSLAMKERESDDLYQYADFNHRLQALFGKERLLRPQDFERVYDWVETLCLPEEVALRLVSFGVQSRGLKFNFAQLDKIAQEWAEAGVKTTRQADELISQDEAMSAGLRQVLRRLGKRHNPSMDDAAIFQKWTKEWGFSLEAILAACAETTKGVPTMAYLDGILKRQHSLGKHDAPSIEAQWLKERTEADTLRPILEAMGVRGTAPTQEWTRVYDAMRAKGFPPGTLLIAAAQVSRQGGKLDDFERLLDAWHQLGLTDESAVEAHITQLQAGNLRLGRLFARAGMDRAPTAKDRAALESWKAEGFADELIDVAAEFAQGTAQPVAFIDRLLRAWRDAGALSVEAARAEHAAHIAKIANAAPRTQPSKQGSLPAQGRSSKEVAEHRYAQRTYSESELDALAVDLFAQEEDGA